MTYSPQIGDYGVVKTNGVAGWLIRLGTFSHFNHAFIYIGDGQIVEARPTGIAIRNVDQYTNVAWNKRDNITEEEREKIVKKAKSFVGEPYGFWQILTIGLKLLGVKVLPGIIKRAENSNSLICSQLVAWSYSYAGIKLSSKPHALVTPYDLAERLIY